MDKETVRFSNASVDYYFNGRFSDIEKITQRKNSIFITDENIFQIHKQLFTEKKVIVIAAGEKSKTQSTINEIVNQLLELESDRNSMLVGIGGGVITDITGFVASIYMRGVSFAFVPTSLLAMVDASIGGKNGIDVGVYKNMLGTIRQPSFIFFDPEFLKTLPESEWINGFAEIIKHAAIKDAEMFRQLEKNDLAYYQENKESLSELIRRNALLKSSVVQNDEFEKGERKLLNFGHTLGHAIENLYSIPHGKAISVGMAFAARLSNTAGRFNQEAELAALLQQYGLPVSFDYHKEKVIDVLRRDKKRSKDSLHYILLSRIGEAFIKELTIDEIYGNL